MLWRRLTASRWRYRLARREAGRPRPRDVDDQLAAIRRAEMIVVSAGGSFSDSFAAHACGWLDSLAGAVALGKPAALLSCGFEHVADGELLRMARLVLPQLHLIGCREGLVGPSLLREFGVDPSRIVVTGDDAVEPAHEARRETLGDAIGVGLRIAPYADLNRDVLETLREALRAAARRRGVPLLALPISVFGPSDARDLEALLGDGGVAAIDRPDRLLAEVSRCRVVVSGSYHAAAFALAQGIPVVAFAASSHYLAKFHGLAHQFGSGCTLLRPADPGFGGALGDALDSAWSTAEQRRPELLESARRQIEAAGGAYRRLRRLA